MKFKHKEEVKILNETFVNFYGVDKGFVISYSYETMPYLKDFNIKYGVLVKIDKKLELKEFKFKEVNLEKLK